MRCTSLQYTCHIRYTSDVQVLEQQGRYYSQLGKDALFQSKNFAAVFCMLRDQAKFSNTMFHTLKCKSLHFVW